MPMHIKGDLKLKPENEKRKQKYFPAVIEITRFEVEDIITTSVGDYTGGEVNPFEGGENPGIDLPIDPF